MQWNMVAVGVSSANPECDGNDDVAAYGCVSVNNGWVLKTTPWLVNTGDETKIFKDGFGNDLEGWKPSVSFDDPSITPRYDDDGITEDRPRVDWFHPPYHASTTIPSRSQKDPCCWTTASLDQTGQPLPGSGVNRGNSYMSVEKANPLGSSPEKAQSCLSPGEDGSLFCSEEAWILY